MSYGVSSPVRKQYEDSGNSYDDRRDRHAKRESSRREQGDN
jgi:hypothetical protein